MIGKLPGHTLSNPAARASGWGLSPAARHYEVIIDVATAMGIASAIHRGRLHDVVEHLCLDCLTRLLVTAREQHLTTIVAVDKCRRECVRCGDPASRQRDAAAAFIR